MQEKSLRKEKDLVITDHIKITYCADAMISQMMEEFESYIKGETLADEIVKINEYNEEYFLNDLKVSIEIEKV